MDHISAVASPLLFNQDDLNCGSNRKTEQISSTPNISDDSDKMRITIKEEITDVDYEFSSLQDCHGYVCVPIHTYLDQKSGKILNPEFEEFLNQLDDKEVDNSRKFFMIAEKTKQSSSTLQPFENDCVFDNKTSVKYLKKETLIGPLDTISVEERENIVSVVISRDENKNRLLSPSVNDDNQSTCSEDIDVVGQSSSEFKCHKCMKKFKSFQKCISHRCKPLDAKSRSKRALKELSRAVERKEKNKPCVCEICNKVLLNKDSLRSHRKFVHATLKPFACQKCGRRYVLKSKLKCHEETHVSNRERQFKCSTCGRLFLWKCDLQRHEDVHKGIKRFVCETCGKQFSRVHHLSAHLRSHSGEKPFPCPQCGKCFSHNETMKYHCKQHETVKKPVSCPLCSTLFSSKTQLGRHLKAHAHENLPACPHCNRKFATEEYLIEHKKEFCKEGQTRACPHCATQFSQLCAYRVHLKTHSVAKRYACTLCDKIYFKQYYYKKHLITAHSNERPVPCPTCGKTFKTKQDLSKHSVIHTKSGRYACKHCDMKFHRPYHLTCHTRTHTGEKPYPCSICGRCFAQTSTMRSHVMKMHTSKSDSINQVKK